MKNLMVLLFFGLIVCVANIFRVDPKMTLIVEKMPIQSSQLILLENKKRLLKSEVSILVNHNAEIIDSAINVNR